VRTARGTSAQGIKQETLIGDVEIRRRLMSSSASASSASMRRSGARRTAGRPGGSLLAIADAGGSARILAQAKPRPGAPVKTTIEPDLQAAAAASLGGRAGGVAVLDARNGDVRALAGQAFSAPQPPGSIFKVITTAAALQEDADVIGLSFLSGAHMHICPRVMELLREKGLDDVLVLVGGIIPDVDIPKLREAGVGGIFLPGTPMQKIIDFVAANVRPRVEQV